MLKRMIVSLAVLCVWSAGVSAYVTGKPGAGDKADARSRKQPGAAGDTAAAAKGGPFAAGLIQYTPPEGWAKSDKDSGPAREVFVAPDHDGIISVEVPPNMIVNKGTAAAVAKRVAETRKKAGKTMVMEPKVEPDDRFDVRVHEQYKQGEHTADQLHLYRKVGPQVVMVTVNSVADDADRTKKIHEAGEAALASAKYTGKAAEKPAAKPPARGARGRG